jgi:ABC-2 type transport system ATP-binding protein
MTDQAQPVVALEDTRKRFPGMTGDALAPLSVSIREGIITGLVGPDGAGKTTLLRLLAGLLSPDAGSVRVLGHDPVREAGRIREQVSYMPQRFGLYEDLSVEENLILNADLRNVTGEQRRKTFDRLLDFTDLHAFLDRRAGALSGGMKQKLGLACALLSRPRLLLLDEPSVGVDPISRRELWEMVGELVGEGMSVIWSSAYLDEAERCDEVLLLNGGENLFHGPPDELTGTVRDRAFLVCGAGERRRRLLATLLGREEVLDAVMQGDRIRVVLHKADQEEAVAEGVRDAGGHLEAVDPRFEDAFLDLVGGGPDGSSGLAESISKRESADSDPVVEARHLTKRFGSFAATDDVSFAIQRGEIFGLLGPNGAGKSTTFKMMCGLLHPSSGEALVSGLSLSKAPGSARQRVGYMAQKFSLYDTLSVGQNLEFFSGVYGLRGRHRRERIRLMVDLFGLGPFLKQAPGSLPLGYKQRLALSCAVMHDPDILFLDEPTSGVDPVTRREFWIHINGLVRKGVTIMVTTHFMEEAEYCDRIGLIHRGRLIALDQPQALKEQTASGDNGNPTMEDAFIELIQRESSEKESAA